MSFAGAARMQVRGRTCPLRKIERTKRRFSRRVNTVTLLLSCGHKIVRPGHIPIRPRAACWQCGK